MGHDELFGVASSMSAIAGIVAAVPKHIERNTDEAFIKATGVEERRIAQNCQDTLTLGTHAAATLIGSLGWVPETIGACIFVTQTPTVRMPAMACHVAGTLGIGYAAFDINLACSGYVYGLWVAAHLPFQRVLLVAGDCVSRMVNPEDKGTVQLFGDAVTATAIDNSQGTKPMRFVIGTDGTGYKHLIADPQIRMNGAEVFNFTLRTVPELVKQTVGADKPDIYAFHQANGFILKHLAKKCEIPEHKVPMNVSRFGNTSSASIPLLLAETVTALASEPRKLALFGFGAGYSWAGAYFEQEPMKVLQLLEVA